MKNDSVAELLKSGEIQSTEDVVFMVRTIIQMIDRGMESENGNILSLAMNLMHNWHDSLNGIDTSLADEAIANIVGAKCE